jgi:ferredoxin-NADP reductase/Fe-S-cluster-containing hydrogenase component 2
MAKLKIEDHPTAKAALAKLQNQVGKQELLDSDWLKKIALECGADDAGVVELSRPALANEKTEVLSRHPWTQTLLAYVVRVNREPIRSPARSISNAEMHGKIEDVNHIGSRIVRELENNGIRAANPSGGFPMEMSRYPGRIWVVSHKLVAVEAGLGHMGIHRNVIHPKFGNFIMLGTVLIEGQATTYGKPIEYNPCLECNLCVAVCPVGAVKTNGEFDFSACYTHNYREFMGGFNDWVEQIADSKSALEYRGRLSEAETSSFWQSLAFGPNYKSAYCLAVCPAGEDVIAPFLADRKRHLTDVVKPLQEKEEEVYVVKGSDAEVHVRKRFDRKRIKYVGNGLHPRSIDQFLSALEFMFQPGQAGDLNATYHFTFTGKESRQATIVIADRQIEVREGHHGKVNLQVSTDTAFWLEFVARERSLPWAILTRKLKMKGSPLLLVKFGKCFPSAGVKHGRAAQVREKTLSDSRRPVFFRNDAVTGRISSILPRWNGTLTVADIVQETPSVKTFRLANPSGAGVPFGYLPGQYLTLALTIAGKRIKRSYTIASTPSRPDCIEITVKREDRGVVSQHLHDRVKVGDYLKVNAPFGEFTFTGQADSSIVLVAGGVGITPMMSVVRYLCDTQWNGEIYLLVGSKKPSEIIFRRELERLQAANSNLQVHFAISTSSDESWTGYKGRINPKFVLKHVPLIQSRRVHICGPDAMMTAVAAMMLELGVPRERIHLEAFGTEGRNPTLVGTTADAKQYKISFSQSMKSATATAADTILDVADQCGVEILNDCRTGNCGSCIAKLLRGNVSMGNAHALNDDERANGYILTCQAKAESDVEIDG